MRPSSCLALRLHVESLKIFLVGDDVPWPITSYVHVVLDLGFVVFQLKGLNNIEIVLIEDIKLLF